MLYCFDFNSPLSTYLPQYAKFEDVVDIMSVIALLRRKYASEELTHKTHPVSIKFEKVINCGISLFLTNKDV